MELYSEPKNLFVAGFIGSPAMNFMPAMVEGDRLKLPMAEVAVSGGRARREEGDVIAGIRREDFEDASLVGDAKVAARPSRPQIDVLESMGSELYAHFSAGTDKAIESRSCASWPRTPAPARSPGAGEEGEIVARLEAASKAQEGSELELWVDATKVKLFDPKDGRNLALGSVPCRTSKVSSPPSQPRTRPRNRSAREVAEYFKKLGATRAVECWGDDVPRGEVTDFYKATQAKEDETPIFSWIEYPDRRRATRRTRA